MANTNIIVKIQQELALARKSQAEGNQGRARVCARRAAGWAVQEYFKRGGIEFDSPSALKHLKQLAKMENLPENVYQSAHRLTIKLEKDSIDEDAYFPIENVDLIEEAHWLAEELLQIKITLSDGS